MKNEFFRSWMFASFCLVAFSAISHGKTIVEERKDALLRFVPLKKVTVGPYDNYQVDVFNSQLVFTRKIDLVPRIFIQSLGDTNAKAFLSAKRDAEQPVFSPDGSKIAMTYYGNTARGQVCLFDRKGNLNFCFDSTGRESSQPDWLGQGEVAFLSKPVGSNLAEIRSFDVKKKSFRVLASGNIASFDISPNGSFMAYTLVENNRSQFFIRDLANKQEKQLKLDIPGVSGFPRYGVENKYLYFNHYLSDTNNDQAIDGDDDSTVYRVDSSVVSKNFSSTQEKAFLPEQLTSQESNCGFPRPTKDKLFVACGYQGSLDVYHLPLTGVVPTTWTAKEIWDTHRASRSYLDRNLLLNAGIIRTNSLARTDFYVRRLSNHVLAENYSAAIELVENLGEILPSGDIKVLEFYLRATKARSTLSGGEVTRDFKRFIKGLQGQLFRTKTSLHSKKVLISLFNFLVGRVTLSRQSFAKVRLSKLSTPSEVYVFFQVAQSLYSKSGDYRWRWSQWVTDIVKKDFLSSEAKSYYLFSYITQLTNILDRTQAQSVIDNLLQKLSAANIQETSLLSSELTLMKLGEIEDQREKRKVFQDLIRSIATIKDNYFLRKAIYIRALMEFARLGDAQYLNYAATNWLTANNRKTAEFSYARDQYIYAMLDRGYKNFDEGKIRYSTSQFYGALLNTDDLESHFAYIKSMIKDGQRAKLDKRYEYLQNKKFIAENMSFVRALLILMDDPSEGADQKKLKEAYSLLEDLDANQFTGVKELLMGYIVLKQVEGSKTKLSVDEKLYNKAHKFLTLAVDLGKDNERIRASAYGNLGLLHFYGRNYGVSSRYFEKRSLLNFGTLEEQSSFSWMYARTLFYNYLPKKAFAVIMKSIEGLKLSNDVLARFYERAGFYAANAGLYLEAKNAYENFFGQSQKLEPSEAMKAQLNYGFSLYKLRKFKSAREVLSRSYLLAKSVKSDDAARVEALSSGLLVNCQGSANPKQDLINNWQALESLKDKLDKIYMRKADWLEYRVRNRSRMLEIHRANKPQLASAAQDLYQVLKDFNGEKGSLISNTNYQSLMDVSLAFVISGAPVSEDWTELLNDTLSAYGDLKTKQVGFEVQRVRLLMVKQYMAQPSQFTKWFEAFAQGNDSLYIQQRSAPRWQAIRSFAKMLPLSKGI